MNRPSQNLNRRRSPHVQRGFAIVTAIFLVVVLAALGAFMVTFSTVQQTTSALDVLGDRAYQAARAGMGWGVFQVTQGNACPTSPTTLPALAGDLALFSVTVTCVPSGPYTEGSATFNLYLITSTAHYGTLGDATYVERQLTATIGG